MSIFSSARVWRSGLSVTASRAALQTSPASPERESFRQHEASTRDINFTQTPCACRTVEPSDLQYLTDEDVEEIGTSC